MCRNLPESIPPKKIVLMAIDRNESETAVLAPLRISYLRAAIPEWLEDAENGLTSQFRWVVHIQSFILDI